MIKISEQFNRNFDKNLRGSVQKNFYRAKYSHDTKNISFGSVVSAANVTKAKEAFLQSTGINLTPLIEELKNNNLLTVASDGAITLLKKGTGTLIKDSVLYPVTKLPLDLVEWGASLLQKVPGLKRAGDAIYNSQILQRNRMSTHLENSLYSLSGIFKDFSSTSENKLTELVLKAGHAKFNPSIGNYDSKKERAANRIVSGVSTAFFLANDAYNLSRVCDDDSEKAKMEKKVRFNQELLRIASMSYLNFIIMSAFPKLMNNSKAFIVGLNTATIFISEVIARWINGKAATFISPEKAQILHKKEEERLVSILKNKEKTNNEGKKSTSVKWSVYLPSDKKASVPSNEKTENKKDNKALLTMPALIKAVIALGVAGFAIIGARKAFPKFDGIVKSVLKRGKDIYNKIVKKDFTMPTEEFNGYMQKFEASGLKPLADKYREIATTNMANGIVTLEKLDKKYKYAVDFVIAPFKFIWGTISLPTNLSKKIFSAIKGGANTGSNYKPNQVLTRVLSTLKQNKTFELSNDAFRQHVSQRIIGSFNDITSSKISNAEISKLAIMASSAATMIFKVADHYNMVMTKSNGKDIEGAKMKARERSMQEVSRLFYKALVVDTFNKAFSNMYHASIMGASAITTAAQVISEGLTRKSVGIPIGESNRAEIFDMDKKQENAKGIVGAYFRFMTKLTGKKPLSHIAHHKNNSKIISVLYQPDTSVYFKKS